MSYGRTTRRRFLQQSAAVGAGFWITGLGAQARRISPNEKLAVAVIGFEGQGKWNLGELCSEDNSKRCDVVALCDVDEARTAEGRAKHPKAAFYTDFRKLFDREKGLDAVLIATPDHTHAPATLLALEARKHVYCEKPLCHSVREVRRVTEAAAKAKVMTQMGTQIHSRSNYRRVVELVQAGVIGDVHEVHVWVGREWGGQDRPAETPPIPEGLHYDLWLGPAPQRPYHPDYLPGKWRGWWDFGGGTLADMACHHMDLPKWALKLTDPVFIEAQGPPVHPESCPVWLIVNYEFPSRDKLPPVRLTWYSGNRRPAYFEQDILPKWGDGTLFVGTRGMLLADYEKHVLLPEEKFADFEPPKPSIPESIGHHAEWLEACRTGKKSLCDFSYAGPLSEAVLLGNVAYRSGVRIEWDAKNFRVRSGRGADAWLDSTHRPGWMPG